MGHILSWFHIPDAVGSKLIHGLCKEFMLKSPRQFVYCDRPQPWILRRYATWLMGNEQGCPAVCRCRPSAREALSVITFIERTFDPAENFK